MRRVAASFLVALGILVPRAGCAQPAGRLEFRASTIAVGRQPGYVTLVDVNGDGRLDLLTGNGGDGNVSILIGDGRGRFSPAPGSPVAVPVAPHFFAFEPGLLAVTGHDSNDVFVYRPDGAGRFRAPSAVPAIRGVPPHNHGLAIADFDSDGVPDLVTSNNNGNSVSVLLGARDGSFRPSAGSPFRVGRAPYPLAVADFDGDGKLDVATPDVNGDTVTVLRGDGRGSLAPAPGSPYRVTARPFFAHATRVNGDRAVDLVVSHDDVSTITVLLNDGKGGFANPRTVDAGGRGWKVRAADFDRDGNTDLVVGVAPASVAVLLGDGSGGFRRAPGSPYAVGRGPWSVAVGDVNGDGKPDVVSANGDDGTVTVLLAVSSAARR